MQKKLFIGPAGWSYKDWEGIVYPPDVVRRHEQLQWISSTFNLVELNSSFYRIPSIRNVKRWIEAVSENPDFVFNLKMPSIFTHKKELNKDYEESFKRVLDEFQNARRLGCVLLQFPWSFKPEREEKIFLHKLLRLFKVFPLTVEVRHRDWLNEKFLRYLRNEKVAFCNIDQPVLKDNLPLTSYVTAPLGYLRLHGRNTKTWFDFSASGAERYNYLYTEAEIYLFIEIIKKCCLKSIQFML